MPPGRFWRDVIGRARKLAITAVPPLYATRRPSGTTVVHRPRQRFTGTAVPISGGAYTVTEARFDAGTMTWSADPDGRVVTAYEYNLETDIASGSAVDVSYFPESNDWRFESVRGCTNRVCVTLRSIVDSSPIEGATVRLSTTGHPDLWTGETDADGRWCSGGIATGVAYALNFEIPASIDTAPDPGPVVALFAASYPGGVPTCGAEHEYDFCEAKLCLNVTDCLTGDPLTGLNRGATIWTGPGPTDFGTTTDYFSYTITDPWGSCTTPPPWHNAYAHYFTNHVYYPPGGVGDSNTDGGQDPDGDGTYCELYFALVERPYSGCPTPPHWTWKVHKHDPTAFVCDQDGHYKPKCGVTSVDCGETASEDVALYPLGADWTYIGGSAPGTNCGVDCETATNTDCDANGLVKRVLTATITGGDPVTGCGADLVGHTFTLTCAGPNGSGQMTWTDGTMTVEFNANGAGFMSVPAHLPDGKACTLTDTLGGQACHPTLLTGGLITNAYTGVTSTVVVVNE